MIADVVTGADGFIGSALVRELLGRGHEVWGVGMDASALEAVADDNRYHPLVASFDVYRDLPRLIQVVHPSCFYHCAWAGGFTSAIADYHLQLENAAHAGDALMAAADMGTQRFVHAGTYNEYEISALIPSGRRKPRATCVYSVAKTAADVVCSALAARRGVEYCIGLIPMPYGEGNRSMQLVNVVLSMLMRGESPKLIEGNDLYDLVHVRDVARGLATIGEMGRPWSAYYIGHRELRTFREWMEEIRDTIAPEIELRFGEYEDEHVIDWSSVGLDALYEDTGFECMESFHETIADTAAWMRVNLLWAFD